MVGMEENHITVVAAEDIESGDVLEHNGVLVGRAINSAVEGDVLAMDADPLVNARVRTRSDNDAVMKCDKCHKPIDDTVAFMLSPVKIESTDSGFTTVGSQIGVFLCFECANDR